MTTNSPLVPVRFYTPQDTYYYETDNRPLQDLAANIQAAAQNADALWPFSQAFPCLDTSNVANSLAAATSSLPASGSLGNGQVVTLRVANTNAAASTFNLNGIGAFPVLANGSALQGGELQRGQDYLLVWLASSSSWLLFTSFAGANQVAAGSHGSNLIIEAQLEDGSLSGDFSDVVAVSAATSGNATFSGQLTAAAASSGAEVITYGQLASGAAGQASLIDWNNVTADSALNVGQVALYNIVNTASTTIPLYIACALGQIYDIVVMNVNPVGTGNGGTNVEFQLLPNNTSYSNQFSQASFGTATSNQAAFYAAPSTAVQYGMACATSSGSSGQGVPETTDAFWVGNFLTASVPPCINTLKIYTGDANTGAVMTCWGGGGLTATSNAGVIVQESVWNNTSTAYTSLGTINQSSGFQTSVIIRVERLL